MSATQQLACTYAALLLADSGKNDVAALLAVTKAAGVDVSKGMATAFASILKTVSINDVLGNVSFAGGAPAGASAGGAAAGSASAGAAAAPAAAAAKEEEEDDDDMGFGLFD